MSTDRRRPCHDEAVPAPSRVLLVVAHGGTGGMQVQVGLLATGLAAQGCEVTVACGPGAIDIGGVALARLPALSARSVGAFVRALRAVVARTSPEVVHGHGLRLAPILRVVAPRRSLVTCHGIAPARVAATAMLTRASRTPVAACGDGPRRALAAHKVRARVLANAIATAPAPAARDTLEALAGGGGGAIAISPARLTEQKDPLGMVRAMAHAPTVRLLLVGGGPLDEAVRREVVRLGLTDRVTVVGWRDDARALLGASDVLCLSSRWEGQPTVVLEAMAAGVPVVATACPGTIETVVDGVTGVLVPVGDPRALGTALERVATAATEAATLVAAARLQATLHTVDVVAAEHLASYRRLLAGTW